MSDPLNTLALDTPVIATEHFDPATYPYEVIGLAEELFDLEANKLLGIRRVDRADRPLDSKGWKMHTLTSDVIVRIGHKAGVIKASPKKPVTCRGTLFVICGKKKETPPCPACGSISPNGLTDMNGNRKAAQ